MKFHRLALGGANLPFQVAREQCDDIRTTTLSRYVGGPLSRRKHRLEIRAYLSTRSMQTALDGLDTQTEDLGNFLRRKTFDIPENEYLSLRRIERGDRTIERCAELTASRGLVRCNVDCGQMTGALQ